MGIEEAMQQQIEDRKTFQKLELANTIKNLTPLNTSQTEIHNRITLNLTLVHECRGDEPRTIQKAASKVLSLREESWSRRVKLNPLHIPFPLGIFAEHPEQIGIVTVQDIAEPTTQVPLLIDPNQNRIIVAYKSNPSRGYEVIPGWPLILKPTNPEELIIRCTHNPDMECRITIFPK